MSWKSKKILLAGADSLMGKSLIAWSEKTGWDLTHDSGDSVDLLDASAVLSWFKKTQPDTVFLMAGKSGGIGANLKYPAELMTDNLSKTLHVLRAAHAAGVRRLIYTASSCVYPKEAPQPLHPRSLFQGALEPSSESYATAKLAGMVLCQAYQKQYGNQFIPVIPADLFGPDDFFDAENAHVIPSLMKKMHQAKIQKLDSVVVWGSGRAVRDFLFVEDAVSAILFLEEHFEGLGPVNISAGNETSINQLAVTLKKVVGYEGELVFDAAQPDGAMRKVLDGSFLRDLGWSPAFDLESGLQKTYDGYLEHETLRV